MRSAAKFGAIFFGSVLTLSGANAMAQQPSPTVIDIPPTAPDAAPAPTPAEMPPNPPSVTCSADTLTISAKNSTLAAVLYAIRGCTGANIDIPDGADERIYSEFGPGPIRTVLADFLNGTDFNYVFGASADNPQKIETVLLMPRGDGKGTKVASASPASSADDANMSANHRAWLETRKNYMQSFTNKEDSGSTEQADSTPAATSAPNADATAGSAETASETPAAPATPNFTPTSAPASTAVVASAASTPGTSSEGKSTQQMINDMRQLFEQRKQMVQQTAPTTSR